MKNKNMPTPEEYNKKYFERLKKWKEQAIGAGVKCPECGEEMVHSDSFILTSDPPQQRILCPKCEYSATIFC